MPINNTRWNRWRYTLYTPVYDRVARYFNASRQRSIEGLEIQPHQKVLIVGAGTGLDLEFLPADCHVVAIDLTPAMVARIRKRQQQSKLFVEAIVMNGQSLEFADSTFDIVILHLILAVIPDPVACLKEAERVLKPSGKISVFDKFVKPVAKLSLLRRTLNLFTNVLFSDITRYFEPIVAQTELLVVSDEHADFGGQFRIIRLMKPVSN